MLPVALPAVKVPVGSVGWISVVVVSALRLPTEEVNVLMGPPGVADVRAVKDVNADADADAAPGNDVAALMVSVDARAERVSRGAEKASSSRAVVVLVAMARERRMVGRLGSMFTVLMRISKTDLSFNERYAMLSWAELSFVISIEWDEIGGVLVIMWIVQRVWMSGVFRDPDIQREGRPAVFKV